jgi:putative oxidoreductase
MRRIAPIMILRESGLAPLLYAYWTAITLGARAVIRGEGRGMALRILDSIAARNEGVILLLGRLAIGWLYLPSGFGKLTGIPGPGLEGFGKYLTSKGLPGPGIGWAAVAAAIEFLASAAIILGIQTRLAAALLVAFTIIAAFLGHPFWAAAADQYQNQYNHFFKDLAIAGGLLYIFVRGAGPISIDRR